MNQEHTQICPICGEDTPEMGRYPNYVCDTCINTHETLTADNKRIQFSNINPFGGFQSKIEGDENYGNQHECFINGIKCHADEARFGGIVIQTVE